jgi:ectoine hydroxylase-related dioxygenase (phytanoyl-CoA dioxygenase family)
MGPMSDDERYRFDLNGYLVRRGALRSTELAALNAAVDALHLPPADNTIQSQRFAGHLASSPTFCALLDHDAIWDVIVELCGSSLRLDHCYGIVMAPGTSGLDLHGGAIPFDPAQYYVHDASGLHCGLVAVQWALADARAGDGGFACIPGSHKSGFERPTSVRLDDALVDEVPLAAGDVVIFTETLTHATLPWRGPHDRRTLLYKYATGNSSWSRDESQPPKLARLLTDRQRLLFEPPYVAYRRPLA